MNPYSKDRKYDLITLVFAAFYIAVGGLLIYWNFIGKISSTIFAIGLFALIVGSLIFKFATDFLRRKKASF